MGRPKLPWGLLKYVRKKILIILAIIALAGVGFGVWQYAAYQDYLKSADKIADDVAHDLTAGNVADVYNNLSDTMKSRLPQDFLRKNYIFPVLSGYKGTIVTHAKGVYVNPQPGAADPYPAKLHLDPHSYAYDFSIGGKTYRVNIVIYHAGSTWKVNELSGAYTS